jgi:CBS domain-containing protein
MESLRVSEIMTTPAWTLQAKDPVAKAKALLSSRGIRRLPVLEGERLIGMLSDRDLRPCASQAPAGPLPLVPSRCETSRTLDRIHVVEIMRRTPVSIGPYHTVREAARIMVDHELHALPVVDQKRVIGIITQTDVLRALLDDPEAPATPGGARSSA